MRWLQELERLKAEFTGGSSAEMRPFVTASFALSGDGYLTQTRGQPTRISGPESMRVTHQLRALHDALLVGVGTVLSDDPALTTRLVAGPSPRRVVLDTQLRVPVTARLLRSTSHAAWLVASSLACEARARELVAAGAEVIRVPRAAEGVSLPALLSHLWSSGVRSLMLEGGAEVLESFFRAGCIDYLVVTTAPRRLANPHAVPLGPHSSEVLRSWRAAQRGLESSSLGADRLETGPLALAAPDPRRARRTAVR